jgi:hypothetical protein
VPITFEDPDDDVVEQLNAVMEEFHPDLQDAELKVAILMAHGDSDDDDGPAIVRGGREHEAIIESVPYKWRCLGVADALITIDAAKWEGLSDAERDALLDEKLQMVRLKMTKDGIRASDDRGRPKLEKRKPDWHLDGYITVAQRHGDAAPEARAAHAAFERGSTRQLFMPWCEGADSSPPVAGTLPMGDGETGDGPASGGGKPKRRRPTKAAAAGAETF